MKQSLSEVRDDEQARSVAEAVARHSYGKLVALVASRTGDLAAAEDALSEAFVKALETWPRDGCPANPEAWLMSVARRKGIDLARRQRVHERAVGEMYASDEFLDAGPEDAPIPDRRLALMFACAHPAVDKAIRAPLILQTVLGLNAAMIASAFLMSPTTMGQRLVRAKAKIKEAGIPFQIPGREELAGRLDAVLDAIYASFAQGWTDPGGTDAARRELADDAIYLGEVVVDLLPKEPEALGLVALMLHAHARLRARRNGKGEYVPFAEQDISGWNFEMIGTAETLLRRASELGSIGRFQLEAAIQSAHVHRRRSGEWNWGSVLQLYDALTAIAPSPVVAINRALAVAEVDGPEAALREIEGLEEDGRMMEYQPYWAARAELLARMREKGEASRAYEMAIGLESDPAVREFLQRRWEVCEA
jgi:predicted RNA polymerase sigma factor